MDLNNVKRQRFSEQFYKDAYRLSGYDIKLIPEIAAIINAKVKELCGLVSPEGALQIILNEINQK